MSTNISISIDFCIGMTPIGNNWNSIARIANLNFNTPPQSVQYGEFTFQTIPFASNNDGALVQVMPS